VYFSERRKARCIPLFPTKHKRNVSIYLTMAINPYRVLTNDLVLEQYNSQYGTSLDDVQDVFDQMPQNYSVYIHSL
jgi:hypothetical protein